jgi:oligoribonuclease NrnB/cAMP/cGMP phosphodiesterase (DHH superfamily)
VLVDYVPGDDFTAFLKNYKTEIIDHHVHEKHLEQFDYFTSADYKLEFSISYLLSLAAEKLGVKDVKWLGRIGAFWDKCLEGTEFYVENIYKDEINNLLPFNLLVSFSQTKGSERLLTMLNESSDIEEAMSKIRESDDYRRAKETFENELKDIKFSRKYFSDIKLSIFWVRTKFKHIRIFVDYITYTTPGTHIFVLDESSRFKLSLRTSSDVNLVDLVREIAAEDKNFSGGGHPKACGAMLRNENIEELLDKLIEKYRKKLNG